jgi:hypothetical protein
VAGTGDFIRSAVKDQFSAQSSPFPSFRMPGISIIFKDFSQGKNDSKS